ncbi:hypothetical protein Q3G72_009065 [Acer saccharum]|nr:hypothetical protein Q3G72_009065 [Acer saccharum]
MEEASSSNPHIKTLEGEIKIRWKPNPQIKDLAGSIKIHTDMEASSSNPRQIETPDDIPVKDNQDHIAWPSGDSEDGDLEMQNRKSSTNSSEKFPILPRDEALGPKLYLVMSKLWDALIQLDGAISIQQCLLRGKANQAFA